MAEARFSLLGYHVTSLSWTGSTGSLDCARMGRLGLSLHTDATARVLLFLTHILASICTNKGCMAQSYLAHLPLAGGTKCNSSLTGV